MSLVLFIYLCSLAANWNFPDAQVGLNYFQVMGGINTWGVDIFRIKELSNNRPLTCLTYAILKVSGHFVQASGIFLSLEVDGGYRRPIRIFERCGSKLKRPK